MLKKTTYTNNNIQCRIQSDMHQQHTQTTTTHNNKKTQKNNTKTTYTNKKPAKNKTTYNHKNNDIQQQQ